MANKMYQERKANISAYRGCAWNCVYCAFQNTLRFQSCEQCKKFEPHAHLEVLDRTPPITKDGEFLTMSLTGDIAFAREQDLVKMLLYCNAWDDRTFVLQSKNPRIFEQYNVLIKPNMVIGTTIESDVDHHMSKAPPPAQRYASMRLLNCRKMVTIEPILKFDLAKLYGWIHLINPEIIYIGYDSKSNNLPEPTLAETKELIKELRTAGYDVREKLIRKAWDEV